jgi:transcriptional regulator with XRE-family HTH domain
VTVKKQAKKMPKETEAIQRVKALRAMLGKTQGEFAKKVGVAQGVVSAWERSEYEPSPESYVKLAQLARYPESLWFLERAGLSMETMVNIANRVLEERISKAVPDEIIHVPSITASEPSLILPTKFVGSSLALKYLKIEPDLAGPILMAGDIVVIDTSNTDLQSLFGKVVLARFAPRASRLTASWTDSWPEGLNVGQIALTEYGPDKFGLTYVIHFLPMTEGESQWLGFYQYRLAPSELAFAGTPKNMAQARKEAARLAPEKIRINEGCEIVGRMILWRSMAEEKK